jgi:tetratricopeptide (TPR) repeat protein
MPEGRLRHSHRRFEEAIACYEQDIAICREANDRYGEGQTLTNLAAVYQKMQQPERAVSYWQEAAAAMRDAGDHAGAARLEQQQR